MGQTAAVVSDPADLREFDCLVPDDVPVGVVAARLAELARFPAQGPDGNPLSYTFVAKGGCAVEPEAVLAEVDLPEPLALRIVPELTIGAGEGDLFSGLEDSPTEPEPVQIGEERCLAHDEGLEMRLDVRVQAAAYRQIDDFASRDRYTECAGLLLGEVALERKTRVANVKAIAPACGAFETRTSVKLTFEAWESMLGLRDSDYPELRVLGWFHTHAGWGVFLSEMDVFVQKSFFAHPNMLAFVLDPTSGHESFFCWKEGRIVQSPTYGLVGAPKQAQTATGPIPKRKRTVAACAAGLAAAGGLYLGFGTRRPPPEPPTPPRARIERAATQSKPAEMIYVLDKRDNLWGVCSRVYGNGDLAPALARYNGIKSFGHLQIGQRIKLPPKHMLESGNR